MLKREKGGMKEWFLKRVRRGNQKETLFGIWAFKMLNRTTEDEGLLQLGLRFIMSREVVSCLIMKTTVQHSKKVIIAITKYSSTYIGIGMVYLAS